MEKIRLSFQTRLWMIGITVCVCSIIAASLVPNPIWTIPFGLVLIIATRIVIRRTLAPLKRLKAQMDKTAAFISAQDALIKTQISLDKNIGLLREALYRYGEPRLAGDQLFFGNRLINNSLEEVDMVKQKAGGTATIFVGDRRIATNIQNPDGSRAVGTKLAKGPAYESVFDKRKTYRGEAEILGVPYLTVYQPIIVDGKVIGIIYAGARKEDSAGLGAEHTATNRGDDLDQMEEAVRTFEQAAFARAEVEANALEQRNMAEQAREEQETMRGAAASIQRTIVTELSVALGRLSDGDLSHRLEAAFPPDYLKLKTDFNAAVEKLQNTMRSVIDASETMSGSSAEISQAAGDLSRRTEQQAAALEQTAAALDEITATIQKTADGAEDTANSVSGARANAERSSVVVNDAVAAMGEIEKSARQISQIIGVIDEIAFQTNLLALNAGVEAARAGDAGRGFAVVASEVRALAQRSASAAKEIKALITASSEQVNRGVALVGETGTALAGIVKQVADINHTVEQIAVASREQSTGLQQVNLAINEMDKVTQQNAAMVEQTTAASGALADEAQRLTELVCSFQIEKPAMQTGAYRSEGLRRRIA